MPKGTTVSLSPLDALGRLVMQGEDSSGAVSVSAIDTYVASGTCTLQVQNGADAGSVSPTVMAQPSNEPRD